MRHAPTVERLSTKGGSAILQLVVVAAVAACAGTSGTGGPGPGLPADPELVVLQFQTGGGLAGPCCDPWAVPDITAYSDGRVVFAGPGIGRVPGVRQATISESDLSRLVVDAQTAGLLDAQPPDAGSVCCDMAYTNVVIADWTTTREIEVMGLGQEAGNGLSAEQIRVRRVLADLQTRLFALAERDSGAYVPSELAAYVLSPIAEDAEPTPWPLDRSLAEGGVRAGNDGRCLHIADEDDAGALMDAAQQSPGNLWSDDGQEWTVFMRPLLPHEHGCPAG